MLRALVTAGVTAALLIGPAAPAPAATTSQVAGAYLQITADGVSTGPGFEGATHAFAALAAIYDVTGDPEQRRTADELLDYILAQRPSHMNTDIALQLLRSPYLQGDARLLSNL